MKFLLITFFAFLIGSITAQSQTMAGTYTSTWESPDGGALTYTLTLNPDNTFRFISHRMYASSHPPKTEEANGVWKSRHRLLKLSTKTSSEDIDLVKELNRNKAKLKTYSPRHKNYDEQKPSLEFYQSKVFYAKDMKLFKKEMGSVVNQDQD